MRIGYALSSEEHDANQLLAAARRADELGFGFAMISDHFHPWTDRQGQSPFVWSVLGAIAARTQRLRLVTGVTCPTVRIHPAVIAQAAATTASLMPGRFTLGVGSGENLNEHIFGGRWPAAGLRLEMLREAVALIRRLWRGEMTSFQGDFYRVENARIYTLPDAPPPIAVAASGPRSARLAADAGDAIIATSPKREVVERYRDAGGEGPRYAKVAVCYAEDEDRAVATATEWWPNEALPGELGQELPLPRHFEQAAELVTPERIRETTVCGPDPERYVEALRSYAEAGFDHVAFHQVGPDQEGFFGFFDRELRRRIADLGSAA
ncbi:MAG TPA: TIGR03557 family F420-dependent LLM class oxidoreductase [Actinomycetota bacterium]|nr:TIGR03557 family F420-dependent LLM class oxidoreductase [Actinomycetota bacterium]